MRRTLMLTLALCGLPAGSAQAATVYANNDSWEVELRYEAGPGEINQLAITYDAVTQRFVFTDPGTPQATLSGLSGNEAASLCTFEPGRTSCWAPAGVGVWMLVRGNDGDDAITAQFTPRSDVTMSLMGDAGNDTIDSQVTFDPVTNPQTGSSLNGGDGNDVLRGSDQNESFTGGPGADEIVGGGGDDSSYWWHATTGVHLTLDGIADDGMPGEGDNYHPSIEQITGTPYDDVLIGGPGSQAFDGDRGDDRLVGGAGVDELWADNGNDVIEARDGEADRIMCGGGSDTVVADLRDLANPQLQFENPTACESVQVGL